MSELIDSIITQLPAHSILNSTRITSLTAQPNSIQLHGITAERNLTHEASHCVITANALATSEIIKDLDPTLSARIASIPYAPVGVLHLLFNRNDFENAPDGFGCLAPPKLGLKTLGIIFSSSLFPSRCPANKILVTAFVGGATKPHCADVENSSTVEEVLNEVTEILGSKNRPTVSSRHYWRKAIPNYSLGHFDIQNAVAEFERRYPRISLIGSWRKGISVSDRVVAATELASNLITAVLKT